MYICEAYMKNSTLSRAELLTRKRISVKGFYTFFVVFKLKISAIPLLSAELNIHVT